MIVQEEGMNTDDILDMSTLVDISIQTGLTWNLLAQMEKELDRYTDASSQTEMTGKQVEQIVCRYSALAKHKKKKCYSSSGQVFKTSSVSTRDSTTGFVTAVQSGMGADGRGFTFHEPHQQQVQLRDSAVESVLTEQVQAQPKFQKSSSVKDSHTTGQAGQPMPEQVEGRRVTRRLSRQTGGEVTSIHSQEKIPRVSENYNKTRAPVSNAEPPTPRDIQHEQRDERHVVYSGKGAVDNVEKNIKDVNLNQGVQKRKVGRPRKKTCLRPAGEIQSSQAEINDVSVRAVSNCQTESNDIIGNVSVREMSNSQAENNDTCGTVSVREMSNSQAERNSIADTVTGPEDGVNSVGMVAVRGRALRNKKVGSVSQSNVRQGSRETCQGQEDSRWDLASPDKLLEMGLYCVTDIKQEVISEHGDNSPEPQYVSMATEPCDQSDLYNIARVAGAHNNECTEMSEQMTQSGASRPTQRTEDALPVVLSVDSHSCINPDPTTVISAATMEVGSERNAGSLLLTCVDEPAADPSPLYLTRVLSCSEDSPPISHVERSANEAEFIAISRSVDNETSAAPDRRQTAVVQVATRGSSAHASDLGTLQTINTFQHNGSLYYGSLLKTEVGTEYLVWQPDNDAAEPEEEEMSVINPKSAALISTSADSTNQTVEEEDELGIVLNEDPKSAMTVVLHQNTDSSATLNTGTNVEVAGPSTENNNVSVPPVKRGRGRPKGSTKKRPGNALKVKPESMQRKTKPAEEPQVKATFRNKTNTGSIQAPVVKPFVGNRSKKLKKNMNHSGTSGQLEKKKFTGPAAAKNEIEASGKDVESKKSMVDLTTHLKPVGRTKKWYQCSYCNYTTVHYSTWRRHEARHLDIRQFECPMCGRQFITKWNLQLHMKTHDKKKGHMCRQCSEMFTYKTQLEKHKRLVHMKGRERVCPFCEKKFTKRNSFKQHMKTHG